RRTRCRPRSAIRFPPCGLLETVAFAFLPQRFPADSENLRRLRLIAADVLQRGRDVAPFDFVERRPMRERVRRADRSRVEHFARQVLEADGVTGGGLERACDRVPQLANVAGPPVIA